MVHLVTCLKCTTPPARSGPLLYIRFRLVDAATQGFYFLFVVINIRSFSHSCLITEFVATLPQWWPILVEQELLTLLQPLSAPTVLMGFMFNYFFVVISRSLLVLFLLPFYCLSFYLWLLITPFVSSSFSNIFVHLDIVTVKFVWVVTYLPYF
jgi:hypothetical protein